MIDSRAEQTHDGPEGFTDSIAIDAWDRTGATSLAVRVRRRPASGVTAAWATVAADGGVVAQVADHDAALIEDWARAAAGGVALETEAPLQRWKLRVDGPGGGGECELRALGPALELDGDRVAPVSRYVQQCEVRGSITVAGTKRRIDGTGIRAHTWGERPPDRRRFVQAATVDGNLVAVIAVRPPGAAHGDELIAGRLLDTQQGGAAPVQFEEVRVSTVFDGDGMPRKAGLELYGPGEELPTRVAGEALWGAPAVADGAALSVSFFRWTVAGHPAWGTYDVEAPA